MSEIRENERKSADIGRDVSTVEKSSEPGLDDDLDRNYEAYLQEGKSVHIEKNGKSEIEQSEKETGEADGDIDSLIDKNYNDYFRSGSESPREE